MDNVIYVKRTKEVTKHFKLMGFKMLNRPQSNFYRVNLIDEVCYSHFLTYGDDLCEWVDYIIFIRNKTIDNIIK